MQKRDKIQRKYKYNQMATIKKNKKNIFKIQNHIQFILKSKEEKKIVEKNTTNIAPGKNASYQKCLHRNSVYSLHHFKPVSNKWLLAQEYRGHGVKKWEKWINSPANKFPSRTIDIKILTRNRDPI